MASDPAGPHHGSTYAVPDAMLSDLAHSASQTRTKNLYTNFVQRLRSGGDSQIPTASSEGTIVKSLTGDVDFRSIENFTGHPIASKSSSTSPQIAITRTNKNQLYPGSAGDIASRPVMMQGSHLPRPDSAYWSASSSIWTAEKSAKIRDRKSTSQSLDFTAPVGREGARAPTPYTQALMAFANSDGHLNEGGAFTNTAVPKTRTSSKVKGDGQLQSSNPAKTITKKKSRFFDPDTDNTDIFVPRTRPQCLAVRVPSDDLAHFFPGLGSPALETATKYKHQRSSSQIVREPITPPVYVNAENNFASRRSGEKYGAKNEAN